MFFWNSLAFSMIQRDVGNLISGSSAFSKTSLNIWKFMVHVLLKSGLENFEHYQRVRWVQLCGSLSILWHCLSLGLEWKLTFSSITYNLICNFISLVHFPEGKFKVRTKESHWLMFNLSVTGFTKKKNLHREKHME